MAVWGVRTPPASAVLRERGSGQRPLEFSVSALPLNPREDELRKTQEAFITAAAAAPCAPAATGIAKDAVPAAAAASEAPATFKANAEQAKRQMQQKQHAATREHLAGLLRQKTESDELQLQQKHQDACFGHPLYRVLIETPGALATDPIWAIELVW